MTHRTKFRPGTVFAWTTLAAALIPATAAAQQDILTKPIVYSVPGMERVQAKTDVTYKRDDGTDLKMDIYGPPSLPSEARVPAVFFIHGGWIPPDLNPKPKDWGVYRSYGRLAAASGFVGVTFNHRYHGWDEANFARSVSDVADAIAFVRDHAAEYHVDPGRICLWAFSGGGPHLTAALREPADYVRCIVSYYALLDLGVATGFGTVALPAETVERYSPVRYIRADNPTIPPVFIARAGLDGAAINQSIAEFTDRAFAHGVTIEVANHPAGRHGFDILDDDARSREIVARTIEFIREHTRGERTGEERVAQQIAALALMIQEGRIAEARARVPELKATAGGAQALVDRLASEESLNRIGYGFMRANKAKEAVAVFEWVVAEHPESLNALDSLSDGYEADGRKKEALETTERVLRLLETVDSPEERRKTIRQNVDERLTRLRSTS